MKIAILTSAAMPNMLPYDLEVVNMLHQRGIDTSVYVWDDIIKSNPNALIHYDAILIRTIWDYFKKVEQFYKLLDFLETLKLPVFNPVEKLRWNMNKKYLQELEGEQPEIIPTVFNTNNSDDSFQKALSLGWKKMILKPMISGNSYHTFVVNSKDEIEFGNLLNKYFQNRPYMLQEFIPEISEGEISVIYFSNGYSYSVKKVPKKGEYRVQFDFGGIYHFGDVDPPIRKICDRISKRIGNEVLYQRVDGLWRDGKFLIMEVELIEPDLYLNLSDEAKKQWVESLIGVLNGN
jgi:glutathione synthase/RimK-type ligase-like ATP-grasp enzyme